MASKASASTVFLISLNLLFFTMVSSYTPPPSTTYPPTKPPCYRPTKPPSSTPGPRPPRPPTCPRNTLDLNICANVLRIISIGGDPGKNPSSQCCSLIEGLVDLEAAVCLCVALKANVLGIINLRLNLFLRILLNYCGRKVPPGYSCAY